MVLFASEQGLDHWRSEAGGILAEIILLDQFSRNIFRGGAMAFDQDRQARKLCRQAMQKGQDMMLAPVHRAFLYMPLQHSELKEDQDMSVECYEQLARSTQGILADFMGSFLQSARDHRAIIQQYGRFPHRNKALGRTSTPEEQNYLEGGRRFGQ
ncbi:MAG: DUF924 family protein, partial [Marinobacter salsuginis]